MNRSTCIRSGISGETVRVTVSGQIVFGPDSSAKVQRQLMGLLSPGLSFLIVDLKGVERMDAAGVGVFVTIFVAARSAGVRLTLVNVTALMSKILNRLGLAILMGDSKTGLPNQCTLPESDANRDNRPTRYCPTLHCGAASPRGAGIHSV